MLESLFNEVAGLQACKFIKKKLQHSCFPVDNEKFLKEQLFLQNTFPVTASTGNAQTFQGKFFRFIKIQKEVAAYSLQTYEKNHQMSFTNFFAATSSQTLLKRLLLSRFTKHFIAELKFKLLFFPVFLMKCSKWFFT